MEKSKRDPSQEETQEREPGYYIMPGDWNTTVQRDSLNLEEVYAVLDTFDEVYDKAMEGLANTEVPTP
jgi:predicted DNA-binding protein (MmcQ/YjbR family)